jgi:hypothetical protein
MFFIFQYSSAKNVKKLAKEMKNMKKADPTAELLISAVTNEKGLRNAFRHLFVVAWLKVTMLCLSPFLVVGAGYNYYFVLRTSKYLILRVLEYLYSSTIHHTRNPCLHLLPVVRFATNLVSLLSANSFSFFSSINLVSLEDILPQ